MTTRNLDAPTRRRIVKVRVEVHEYTSPTYGSPDVGSAEFVGTEGLIDVAGIAGAVAEAAGSLLARPHLPEPPRAADAPTTSDLDALPI